MQPYAPHFVLIHAPLVGPMTWSPAAAVLRKKGFPVSLPVLSSRGQGEPFWQQHAGAVAAAVEKTSSALAQSGSAEPPLVLVAHSGAGPLLPAIHRQLSRPPAADILVDALFPQSGKSRLELFENAWAADEFRRSAENGWLPVWTEDDLRDVITDDALRRGFVEELRPLPLAVYEEPLPVFESWPDAPAAYLRFGGNPAYDLSFQQARDSGCLLEQMDGQHFEMLEHPRLVAEMLVSLVRRLGILFAEEGTHA